MVSRVLQFCCDAGPGTAKVTIYTDATRTVIHQEVTLSAPGGGIVYGPCVAADFPMDASNKAYYKFTYLSGPSNTTVRLKIWHTPTGWTGWTNPTVSPGWTYNVTYQSADPDCFGWPSDCAPFPTRKFGMKKPT